MKIYATFALASFVATGVLATEATCNVNGVSVADITLETGECPFEVPAAYEVYASITSLEDYNVSFYYAVINGIKHFPDILTGSREIEISALDAYHYTPQIYHVSSSRVRASNSSVYVSHKMNKLNKRDVVTDTVSYLQTLEGVPVSDIQFSVALKEPSSTELILTVLALESTQIADSTIIVTSTSCSDNICDETTISITPSVVTRTDNGETTIYTTYCPVTDEHVSETEVHTVTESSVSTTIITTTSCSDNKCDEETLAATPSVVTKTDNGETTVYTTFCPVTDKNTSDTETSTVTETSDSTIFVTLTSCSDNKCDEETLAITPSVVTKTDNGDATVYTTYCPVTEENEFDSGANTVTKTVDSTIIVTTTSCSDNKCNEETLAVTPSVVTSTNNGEPVTYTTYQPVAEETIIDVVTKTAQDTVNIISSSCSYDECTEDKTTNIPTLTTEIIDGEETIILTYQQNPTTEISEDIDTSSTLGDISNSSPTEAYSTSSAHIGTTVSTYGGATTLNFSKLFLFLISFMAAF